MAPRFSTAKNVRYEFTTATYFGAADDPTSNRIKRGPASAAFNSSVNVGQVYAVNASTGLVRGGRFNDGGGRGPFPALMNIRLSI